MSSYHDKSYGLSRAKEKAIKNTTLLQGGKLVFSFFALLMLCAFLSTII